jgi:sugar lactone lactonase YvrE
MRFETVVPVPVPPPVLPGADALAVGWKRVAEGQALLGETPLWCEQTESLLWLDVDRARLHRLHVPSGRRDDHVFNAAHAGSLALRQPGQVLLALDLALYLLDLGTGSLALLSQVEPAGVGTRLNDGRCDSLGRFWVTTMDNGLAQPLGGVYRVDPSGHVERMFGDVIVGNTIAFAPNGQTMYFSDTRGFVTYAFDVDVPKGQLSNRRVLGDHRLRRERPDGACVDAEGCIWIAFFGGACVRRYKPDGTLDREIPVPVSNPTCLCLGGPDRCTLYVTTARKFLSEEQLSVQPWAGSVLALQVGVPGLPEKRFGR